ncbi:MAG TPA: cupin domain-containing protein [Pyrinomonadaceae bacterium]|nr:cupin domain-containing protein [Pyrinomonadaceae bacterium]
MSLEIERWSENDSPDSQTLRERMEAEGYSVFESRDAAGTTYGPHSHTEDQSHWIINGALVIRIGWEEYTLRAGDRDYLPANTEHSATVPRDEAVFYLIGIKY